MPLADNMRQYGNTETMGDYMPASAEHSLKKRTIWEPMGDNTEKMAGTVLKMRSQSETTGDNTGISTEIALKVYCQRETATDRWNTLITRQLDLQDVICQVRTLSRSAVCVMSAITVIVLHIIVLSLFVRFGPKANATNQFLVRAKFYPAKIVQ